MLTDEKKFDAQQVVNQQNEQVWNSSSSTEGRIVSRYQNSPSVGIWAAVTETGKSPLLFVPFGVKLNSQRYIADILENCLLPWAKKHFQGLPWSLQQNFALVHASKITQSWNQRKISSFISNEVWPVRSPDLKTLNFCIWSILETKTCCSPRPTVEPLKTKLVREWAVIAQETIRVACTSFSDRLRAVTKNKGHYIEYIFFFV